MPASLLPIASLALHLGEVDRATMHPDGRFESDTTHTVMLTLIACAVAAEHPELCLNVGLVAQFATVHDLPEALCGDTDTFHAQTADQRHATSDREAQAATKIAQDTHDYVWIGRMINRYRDQGEPEARFVRFMDKICPRLTNALNHGRAIRARGQALRDLVARDTTHIADLCATYPEYAEVCGALMRDAAAESVRAWDDSVG